MKRIAVRLSALTAVLSLGTFAVVQAQRSNHPAPSEVATAETATAAAGEPAALDIDEQSIKPMPPADEPADRYARAEMPHATQAAAVDPFTQGAAVPLSEAAPQEAYEPAPLPQAEDPQGIPPASEALRRYAPEGASQSGAGRGEIQPLGYDDANEPTAGQSPDDAPHDVADESAAEAFAPPGRNEPTLAPPRPGGRYAPAAEPEIAEAALEGAAIGGSAAAVGNSLRGASRGEAAAPSAAADRYSPTKNTAGRAPAGGREPALLPDDSLTTDDSAPLAAAEADNFARPLRSRAAATSEGSGRPGGRHLEGQQAPHLTIEKIAPTDVQVGKPAVFTLKIRNTGPVAAAHVEVHDQVPKGTQLLSTTPKAVEQAPGELLWSLGTLKSGEETTVAIELMPVAEGEIGSVATVHFAAETSVRTLVTKPVLALDIKSPPEVQLGEDVTLSIKLSNTGTGAATGVVLREAVPEMLQHPAGAELEYEVGVLKPGETRELDLTMRAVKAGRVVNQITAIGEGSVRVDQQADLEVVAAELQVKMDGPSRRFLDRQATYTVSVSNPGTAPAKDISLVTHLPAGLKFVEANNAGQYDARTRSVHWSLEELPANDTGSVTLVTVPVESGEQLMRIESTAERGLAAQVEKIITVEGVAAINFEVVDVADPIEVGGDTAYEVRIVNQGTKAASNVQVVVLLPEELEPTGAEGPVRYTIDGQRVLFEPLPQVAPKADTTYRVKAKGRGPGDVRIRVQVLTDDIRTPVTKEESTRVYADEQ